MQIYAEAESRAKELVQFCYAEAQQYMWRSQILAEAESRAKELVQFCYAEAQQYMWRSQIEYPK